MLQGSVASAESPAGSARAHPRRLGFASGSRRALPRPAAVVSDEQILVLVASADGPRRRRQRQRDADDSPSVAAERLLCLDGAVRTGGLVPADRAAQAVTSTSGAAQPQQGQL